MTRPAPSEPRYPDRAHPIYRALPIAEALDALDARHGPSDCSDAALAAEALVIDAGEAAGGLSTNGFRSDLLLHVEHAERDQADADHDAELVHSGGYHRGNPFEAPPISTSAYRVGWGVANQWISDVTASLARHGMRFDGREIVSVMRRAA